MIVVTMVCVVRRLRISCALNSHQMQLMNLESCVYGYRYSCFTLAKKQQQKQQHTTEDALLYEFQTLIEYHNGPC